MSCKEICPYNTLRGCTVEEYGIECISKEQQREMDKYTATELAYKNGFQAGLQAAWENFILEHFYVENDKVTLIGECQNIPFKMTVPFNKKNIFEINKKEKEICG